MNPVPPGTQDSDCCGQGCSPCVLDLYDQELKSWRRACDLIERGLNPEASSVAPGEEMSPENYVGCILRDIRSETPACKTFKFDLPRGRALTARPGQHLLLKLETESESFTRQFTILLPPPQQQHQQQSDGDGGSPQRLATFEVLIKLYEGGRASELIREWRVGQEALWRGPFGGFSYERNSFKFVVVLAVGTGTLPMVTAVESLLADGEDETRVEVLLGFRSAADLLLGGRWRDIAGFWNVAVELFFSRTTEVVAKCSFAKAIHPGARIGLEDILKRAKRSEETMYLVCGTTDFEKSSISTLQAIGVPADRIKKF